MLFVNFRFVCQTAIRRPGNESMRGIGFQADLDSETSLYRIQWDLLLIQMICSTTCFESDDVSHGKGRGGVMHPSSARTFPWQTLGWWGSDGIGLEGARVIRGSRRVCCGAFCIVIYSTWWHLPSNPLMKFTNNCTFCFWLQTGINMLVFRYFQVFHQNGWCSSFSRITG